MLDNKRKIFGLIFLIIPVLIGLFMIHRETIKKSDMAVLTGKVLSKNIISIYSFKGGRHYFLIFEIENQQNKIAINYPTESQAKNDSAYNLVDTGRTYKFYLDPSYPTKDSFNCGIDVIDYEGVEIYRASTTANLYAGVFFILLGFISSYAIVKYKSKK